MPIITQITEQKRRPNRRNVFLDGSFAFGCNVNVVARFRLRQGMELSQEKIAEIEIGAVRQECFDKAMDFLTRRLHGTVELCKKLKKHEWGDRIIDLVVEDLKRMNYLDDARFAHSRAASLAKHKRHGRRRAFMELIRSGISSPLASEAVAGVYDQARSGEIVRGLVLRQIVRLKKLDRTVARRRLTGTLQRRGFGYEEIRPVVDEFLPVEARKKSKK